MKETDKEIMPEEFVYIDPYWGRTVRYESDFDYIHEVTKNFLGSDFSMMLLGNKDKADDSYIEHFERIRSYEENVRKMLQIVFNAHDGYDYINPKEIKETSADFSFGCEDNERAYFFFNRTDDTTIEVEIINDCIEIFFCDSVCNERWYGFVNNPDILEKEE